VKWGIVLSSTRFLDPAAAIILGQAAEAAGFESLWVAEPVVVPDPLMWFAFVAAGTSTIRFGSGALVAPEQPPMALARTATRLDELARGRLLFGVGIGQPPGDPPEPGLGTDDRDRWMDDYLEALRTQCHHEAPLAREIPLHIGGASEADLRRAARWGDGLFVSLRPEDAPVALPRLLGRLSGACAAIDRDPADLELTAGARTLGEARWYASQGITRLTVTVQPAGHHTLCAEIARWGAELVAPSKDW
jgi:alkanesulfonate monooxygenase SsuD/methylene tetrahydromethanopterin reductase-like flavin-dependent oxidoreductase (luciferase family)